MSYFVRSARRKCPSVEDEQRCNSTVNGEDDPVAPCTVLRGWHQSQYREWYGIARALKISPVSILYRVRHELLMAGKVHQNAMAYQEVLLHVMFPGGGVIGDVL